MEGEVASESEAQAARVVSSDLDLVREAYVGDVGKVYAPDE